MLKDIDVQNSRCSENSPATNLFKAIELMQTLNFYLMFSKSCFSQESSNWKNEMKGAAKDWRLFVIRNR